ncbi:MAG: ABC transporter permease [Lachnospiraceae bacterium]
MTIVMGVLEQGFIYAILALGVYITYKILDFPDLTVDGSFPLGAAVSAVLITKGMNPVLTLLIAALAGALAGMVTGIIHVKFHVRDLISSVITMTALYTVNLRIASGKANVPLFAEKTIFSNDFISPYTTLIVILVVAAIAKLMLDGYLKTKSGFLLRAVGDNEVIVTSLAKDSGKVKITGLAIANSLVALSGAVMSQQQGFFDVSMGTGAIVIGLASVIMGTNLFRNFYRIKDTTAVVVGSVLYKACVAAAIALGLSASDLKFVTAAFLFIILIFNVNRKKVKTHA